MGKLKDYARKLKAITEDEQRIALLAIVQTNKEVALDMNTGQLFKGRNSLGAFISPPYRSPIYAELKLHMNPAGVVDLNLTGSFYRGWYIQAQASPIKIKFNSRDVKTKELTDKYGEEIFGLDRENLKSFASEYVKPDYLKYFRKLLHL